MAYRAEIEIGVKGAKNLEQALKQITELSKSIDNTNKRTIFGTKQVANLNEYARAVEKARRNLNKARIQLDDAGNATKTYKKAIDQFVSALGASNQAQKITNDLIEQEISARTKATAQLKAYNAAAAPPRQAGGSLAGRYLRPGSAASRTQFSSPIGPQPGVQFGSTTQFGPVGGPSSSVLGGQSSPVAEKIQRQLKKLAEERIAQERQIRAANNETIKVLERRARIEQKIADVRSARIARESSASFLGSSGTQPQGPFAGAGALGFPVALPLLKGERKALDTSNKIAEILERRKRLQKELGGSAEKLAAVTRRGITDEERVNGQIRQRFGLRGALQALENKSLAAIAKANREEDELTQEKTKQLELEKLINKERVKQSVSRRRRIVNTAREASRRRKEAVSSAIIGGAFPLLFGQGGGAAVGGALGGLGGGFLGGQFGFGLSLVGTQLGAIFDQTIANAQEAGQALTSTGSALDFMREKSLFSTAAAKERAAELEELGRVEELAAELTKELVDKIGNKGVESLQGLGKETDETTRLWAELTLQLQALISGPLKGFLTIVNSVLRGVTTAGRFKALEEDFAGNAAFEAAVLEARKKGGRKGAAASLGPVQTKDQIALLERAAAGEFGARPITATIPVTPEDERRFAVKDTAGDKAAREAARIDARIEKLRLERQEIAKITEFKDKIAAAEALQDKLLVRKLQGEQNVFKIQQEGLEKLVGVKTEREKEAIQLTTKAKIVAAERDTEREITEILRQRNELFTNTITNLQSQLDIATATTREEAEQLRLEQDLQTLRESNNFTEPQLQQIAALKQSLVETQQPLNQFITESTRSLNDLEQVAVTVSEGIGQAFGQAMTVGLDELVSGTKSAEEVFADFLKNIANLLLQVAGQMIATYVAIGVARTFAGVPASTTPPTTLPGSATQTGLGLNLNGVDQGINLGVAANGGPVKSGNPYIIGERGPELFVPRSNGRIVPNGRFGGGSGGDVSVVVNVDAKGSSAEGNQPNAKALGAAIGAAVQSEIIKQKRPGGLLYSSL